MADSNIEMSWDSFTKLLDILVDKRIHIESRLYTSNERRVSSKLEELIEIANSRGTNRSEESVR